MKKFIIAIFVLCAVPFTVFSADSEIIVSGEWARPILIEGRPGSAYFHIENKGDTVDKLVSVTSSVSPRVEIHEHTMKDGVMKMSQVPSIDIPASGTVELKPGGYHIMIFETSTKYELGDEIDLNLNFEKAGEIKKTVKVMAQPPQ